MDDIFKIENLPESVLKELFIPKKRDYEELRPISVKVLSLFNIKKKLNCNDILIGLFKKYGICKSRHSVNALIFLLKKKKFIESTPVVGYYQRTRKKCKDSVS